jgi:hypothetical protein
MKRIIEFIIYYTGAVLMIVAVYEVINGEKFIYFNTIFEIFGACIAITLGVYFRNKIIEIRNFILEYIVDFSYTILVVLLFGLVFNWYDTLPVWFLIVLIIVVDIFSIIIVFNKMHKDIEEINKLLKKRREKNNDTL